MKKRFWRRILSLAAALTMLLALAVSASATTSPLYIVSNYPDNVTVNANSAYTFSVTVTGGSNITYQWCANHSPIPGAPNSPTVSLSFPNDTVVYCVVQSGEYIASSKPCTVSVGSSTVTPGTGSTPITPGTGGILNSAVPVSAPTITKQPVSVKIAQGQSATLSVAATCAYLGSGVDLRYQWYMSTTNNAASAAPIPNATSATYTTPALTADTYYLVAVWSTNGSANSSVVYSNLVSVGYGSNEFKITKHPTGETVNAGQSALFIARADNAVSHEWRLVSRDTTRTVPATQAAYYFRGLSVTGETTDSLALSNIPAELNGWSVECKFMAADGRTLYTNGAVLNVLSPSPSPSATPTILATPMPSATPAPAAGTAVAAPVINSQPSGAVLSEGNTVTLAVGATVAAPSEGVTLKYQWYRNTQNSNANGTAISGATSETYVPDTISGSRYYYVGVTATDGTNVSKTIYSSPVTVTYTAPISTPTPAPTAAPDPDRGGSNSGGLGSLLLGPIIAIVVAAALIGVGMFFLLKNIGSKNSRRDDRYYRDYYDDDEFDDRRR